MSSTMPSAPRRSHLDRAAFRDNAFLADRMASWFPEFSAEQIEAILAQLSQDEYWKLFKEVFVLNTSCNIRVTSRVLAQHGWFIDMGVPPSSAIRVAELFHAGKEEEAHAELEAYYMERRSSIEAELKARFPRRARFLGGCFRSHDAGDFDASIPLCLIQADGICHDIFGDELFRVKGRSLRVRKKVDSKKVDWVWEAASEPLRDLLPIATHESPGIGKFNRHVILHGTDLEYGTKRNSLRAIALLSYLQSMAAYEEQRKADPVEPQG